jgi:hypothetical protein
MRRKSKEKTEFEWETIGYMPERFITSYFELVRVGLHMAPSVRDEYNESANVRRKFVTHAGGLKDEKALRFKAWVDRQLRAIGRDVQAYLNAREGVSRIVTGMDGEEQRLLGHEIAKEMERKSELKCRGCGKYVSWQWTFCAWCGGKVVGGSKVS